MYKLAHFNLNVLNFKKSIKFYKEALDLEIKKEYKKDNLTFVYLTDKKTDFTIELTHLSDRNEKYKLGDNEIHLAVKAENFVESYERHKKMDSICYESKEMGIYFITDPDRYWIEIIGSY